MQTVTEIPEFSSNVARLLSGQEVQALIGHLAEHPRAGVLIPGTDSVRKLRWTREGMGKSRGVRVMHYFYDEQLPVYLLTVVGKDQKPI